MLTADEVRRVVAGDLSAQEAQAIVSQRAEEVEIASQGEPPEVVVGDVAELIRIPGRRVFRGIPSSRGRHTGRVVICRGIADLDRIANGDVVVVPYSDASWTPLFLHAGAIVAESGGLLSHSAILSRELGVPSIVSVRGALAMDDGALVSVDGFEGTVTVLDTA
jgi:phosphoenolpyruvate synthase/pyruvate phosphate dikinase